MALPEFREQLLQGLRTPRDELARRFAVRCNAPVQAGLLDCGRVRNEHQEHRRIFANLSSALDILHIHDEEDALLENLPEISQQGKGSVQPTRCPGSQGP